MSKDVLMVGGRAYKRPHRKLRKEKVLGSKFKHTTSAKRACTQCRAQLIVTRLRYVKKNSYMQPATICACGTKNYFSPHAR